MATKIEALIRKTALDTAVAALPAGASPGQYVEYAIEFEHYLTTGVQKPRQAAQTPAHRDSGARAQR